MRACRLLGAHQRETSATLSDHGESDARFAELAHRDAARLRLGRLRSGAGDAQSGKGSANEGAALYRGRSAVRHSVLARGTIWNLQPIRKIHSVDEFHRFLRSGPREVYNSATGLPK